MTTHAQDAVSRPRDVEHPAPGSDAAAPLRVRDGQAVIDDLAADSQDTLTSMIGG